MDTLSFRKPVLDPGFVPLGLWNRAYLREADVPFGIAIERGDGQVSVTRSFLRAGGAGGAAEDAPSAGGAGEADAATAYFAERLVKFLLWQKGGFRVWLEGPASVCERIAQAYAPGGARAFDAAFMGRLYRRPFEVRRTARLPDAAESGQTPGWDKAGCRIGFDAGGSDRKVSAVRDGQVVYSEETVWEPKTQTDPRYHLDGVVSALRNAAAALPRVDAIGVSSAGIYEGNRTLYAQLFGKVPPADFDAVIRELYPTAARAACGDVPLCVANDGDVTALTGAIVLDKANLLGIALGTSEAAGFVDRNGRITGWLNELAFAPVSVSQGMRTQANAPDGGRTGEKQRFPKETPMKAMAIDGGYDEVRQRFPDPAPVDAWSGDVGCGVSYLSQEAVIRLSGIAGIVFAETDAPGAKLKRVQELLAQGEAAARQIFQTIGCYLGHIVAQYFDMYGATSFLLLGRVMSGEGGERILCEAKAVLREDYPELSLELLLPNEEMRRLGQSVTAAYLSSR